MDDNMEENLESYKAQLKQVEAALLLDETDEDLQKLKQDLQEVIALTQDLMGLNEPAEETLTLTALDSSVATPSKPVQWKVGDRVQVLKKQDNNLHTGKIDMIADDGISCTVKFDNSGSVDVLKVSELRLTDEAKAKVATASSSTTSKKLTKEEIERRKEIKKNKLLKKKQRMKDFEEARENGKQNWQTFFKKGNLKGKHKVKGLNKKSIFASAADGKGKIGIGTCGTSGKGMTSYTPATQYMYKK